jgi:hypothetical protein
MSGNFLLQRANYEVSKNKVVIEGTYIVAQKLEQRLSAIFGSEKSISSNWPQSLLRIPRINSKPPMKGEALAGRRLVTSSLG